MVEHEKHGPVDTLNWAFSRVSMWIVPVIVAIMFYEVFMRYVLFRPTYWVNEMSLWLAGAVYVTAGLYAMQQRSHIRIFVLYDMAPVWMRKLFDLISALCVCIFVFAVIWGGYGEAVAKLWRWERFGTVFDPPIPATNKPLVLITLFLLALQTIATLIRDWPANANVRKLFDIVATASLLVLGAMALPVLFDFSENGPTVPLAWRIGLAIVVVISAAVLLFGLVRDFNREPVIGEIEEEDPATEFGIVPDEILSGNPPKTNDK